MTDATKTVRVVAFQEDGAWIAQCVEYDICTQGRDLTQAQRRMRVALRHEAIFTKDKFGQEFAGLDLAPDYFSAEIGVVDSEPNIRNKLSRGKFTAVFLVQCLEAIGVRNLSID